MIIAGAPIKLVASPPAAGESSPQNLQAEEPKNTPTPLREALREALGDVPRGHDVIRNESGQIVGISTCRQPSTRPVDRPPSQCGEILIEQAVGSHAKQFRTEISGLLDCIDDDRMPRVRYRAAVAIRATASRVDLRSRPARDAPQMQIDETDCLLGKVRKIVSSGGPDAGLALKLLVVSY